MSFEGMSIDGTMFFQTSFGGRNPQGQLSLQSEEIETGGGSKQTASDRYAGG